MKELKDYVDQLFAKQPQTAETEDLKQEILGNLQEKAADYQYEGMAYEEAIIKAKHSLTSLDFLIEEENAIYINRYRLEWMQGLLLYLLIAWIVTMPITLIRPSFWLSLVLPLSLVLSLLIYGFLYFKYKKTDQLDLVAQIDLSKRQQWSRIAWITWAIYMIVMILFITALHFSSNLWFGRPVRIDGPYQLALILLDYVIPFLSVLIPLLFRQSARLPNKHEVKHNDH